MNIYLYMKEGSLFCFVVMRSPPTSDASDLVVLGVFGKLLSRLGDLTLRVPNMGFWFHDIWTCGAKVFEY
jgi:hypothetical protein